MATMKTRHSRYDYIPEKGLKDLDGEDATGIVVKKHPRFDFIKEGDEKKVDKIMQKETALKKSKKLEFNGDTATVLGKCRKCGKIHKTPELALLCKCNNKSKKTAEKAEKGGK